MQPLIQSLAFGSLLLFSLSAPAVAQLPELSNEESDYLAALLSTKDADRQEVARQLAGDPPIPIIAHLCFHSTQSKTRQVALQSLKMLDANYGNAVGALIIGDATDKRLAAMLTLRNFGYRGKFASPAIQVEAERGRRALEASNREGWKHLDDTVRSDLNCYKVALWLLGQYESNEEACDFLLDQVEFEIQAKQPGRLAEVEALLFSEGTDSLFKGPGRNDWYAGPFTAVGVLAASNRPLRPKIVEHLRRQLRGASAIRKIQGARTLTTCAGAAAPAMAELIELAREDEDPRVREAAVNAAEMIKARIAAAQLLGDGSDFQVLINMLASGDDSASRTEALEWIVNRQPRLFRFANAMFRSAVEPGHYRQLQESLTPTNLRSVDIEPIAMMLDSHTQFLLQVNALVISTAEDEATRRMLESRETVSRMELAEHQIQLLARIFEFDQQLSQLTLLLEQHQTANTPDDHKSASQKVVAMLSEEANPAVREKLRQLVPARGRGALMRHALTQETEQDEFARRKTLGDMTKHLELLVAWSKADPAVTTELCDYLFGDLHLLYIGGPGNDSGHLVAPPLIERYLETLGKFGEYPKQRAMEFGERAKVLASDPHYSPQVRSQITLYEREVMSRLISGGPN